MPKVSENGFLVTYEPEELQAEIDKILARYPFLENYRPTCCNAWEDFSNPELVTSVEELSKWRWLLTGRHWPGD